MLAVAAAGFAVPVQSSAAHPLEHPPLPVPATATTSLVTKQRDAVARAVVTHRRLVAARIVLRRHKGAVTGDGATRYVANGTTFRPRSTIVPLPPRIRARAWTVVDLDTGRLLGRHRARAPLPQASTLKLLTAVTAVRTLKSRWPHRVTRFEHRQTCSCAGLKPGRYYRFKVLLEGMLLPSGNDAAEAIAGFEPRGRLAFYRAMNEMARELGATDTVARNASGLTAPGTHSSARDLVVFLRAALSHPLLVDVMSRRSAQIATVDGHLGHPVWRATDYVNRYPGSLGKSGFTTPAKNTLVVVTPIRGHRIAVALLGSPGNTTDSARALTTWAARNLGHLRAVGILPRS